MSKRCHDCKHLQREWRCAVPLPMHMESVQVRDEPNHDSHASDCECFERREGRTSDAESCAHCGGSMGEGAVCEKCHELLYDKPIQAPTKVCMLVPRHIEYVGGIKLFANPTVVEGNNPGDVLITGVPVFGVDPPITKDEAIRAGGEPTDIPPETTKETP